MRFLLFLLLLITSSAYAQDECASNLNPRYIYGISQSSDTRFIRILNDVAKRAGLGNNVPLLCEHNGSGAGPLPYTLLMLLASGEPRFAIVLPDTMRDWNEEELFGVVAHELAHAKTGLRALLTNEELLLHEIQIDREAARWVGRTVVVAMLRALLERTIPDSPAKYREGFRKQVEERLRALQ